MIGLLKANALFRWNEEVDQAFKLLKQALTSALVLAQPNFHQPFIFKTNGSSNDIRAVIIQENHHIAYISKVLSLCHRSLPAYDRELFAIKKWHPYLVGGRFIIRSDHQQLKHLF